MREIKFRAFCTVRGMSDPFFLFSTIIKFDGAEHDLLLIYDNLQIVEFTGLRDKNGAEIFEGDIITFRYYYDHGQWGEYHSRQMIVDFTDPSHLIRGLARSSVGYGDVDLEGIQVIGNIHENSELLK